MKMVIGLATVAALFAIGGGVERSDGDAKHVSPTNGNEQSIAAVTTTQPARGSGCMVYDVRIELALFGSGTHLVDVTDRVVQLLRSKPEGFTARADSLDVDPVPGKNKSLLIRYRFQNQESLFMVTGGNKASYTLLTEPKANN